MSGILDTFTKQPNEVLDYDVKFTPWLSETDEVISVDAFADTGIDLGDTVIDSSGKVVKQWISGGEDGEIYKIQLRALTKDGRVKEADFKIRVKEI